MPADTTGKALQVLDLMLEFFADDNHWARGCYHDRDGRHCLIGAVLHFTASHGLPRAPVMSLLEAALPRRQIGLIAFNDRLRRSAAELRSVILRARAVALENAKHERAAAHSKIGSSPNWNATGPCAGVPGTRPPRRCICLRSGSQRDSRPATWRTEAWHDVSSSTLRRVAVRKAARRSLSHHSARGAAASALSILRPARVRANWPHEPRLPCSSDRKIHVS
jgi:hypothetical protein